MLGKVVSPKLTKEPCHTTSRGALPMVTTMVVMRSPAPPPHQVTCCVGGGGSIALLGKELVVVLLGVHSPVALHENGLTVA